MRPFLTPSSCSLRIDGDYLSLFFLLVCISVLALTVGIWILKLGRLGETG